MGLRRHQGQAGQFQPAGIDHRVFGKGQREEPRFGQNGGADNSFGTRKALMLILDVTLPCGELVIERRQAAVGRFISWEKPTEREIILHVGRFTCMVTSFRAKTVSGVLQGFVATAPIFLLATLDMSLLITNHPPT